MIEVLGVKNADKLVPTDDDAKPVDPISENMAALVGKPMKAFIYQDHDAHIGAHTAFMQDPKVAQLIGQNPQAQQIMASLQAHIAEHLGFSYRKQLEEKLGAPLPPPDQPLSEEVELQLSRLIASAGQQVTQANQQEAAQREAQQQAQDPVLQLQREELAVKQAEVQRKSQKDQADAAIQQAELARKAQKDQVDSAIDAQKVENEQAALLVDAQKAKLKVDSDMLKDAEKLDLEVYKTVTGNSNQRR